MGQSFWKSRLTRLWTTGLDLVFPIACLGCGKEGPLACRHCLSLIPEPDSQVCPECKAPFSPSGATCTRCRSQTALDGLFVARIYRFRFLQNLIYALKYQFLQKTIPALVWLLQESLAHHPLPLPDLIIPVPLHSRRLRWRGFNQAELLAQELQKNLAPGLVIPLDTTSLKRIRLTQPQMKTDTRGERLQNIMGAFLVRPEIAGPLVGKYVWLIDDVATTGTTLNECARALKLAGVKKVWGIVIAR